MKMGSFSEQQLNELLQKASKKAGTTPEELKRRLEGQSVDAALKNINPSDAAKVKRVLSDPALTQQLLSSPQAQLLMKKLTGEK